MEQTKESKKFEYKETLNSARIIVPIILKLLKIKSVVDVGCGEGFWLSAFQESGIKNVFGIDSAEVKLQSLQISRENFFATDLADPVIVKGHYDLVMSLETAEHLPKISAKKFVKLLTSLGNVVLFSAAIPFQGGYKHINEQWPEYWEKYFNEQGYIVVDCLRKKIWSDERVKWWYAQNIFIYVKKDKLHNYPTLKKELEYSKNTPLSLVHPNAFNYSNITVGLLKYKIREKLRKFFV